MVGIKRRIPIDGIIGGIEFVGIGLGICVIPRGIGPFQSGSDYRQLAALLTVSQDRVTFADGKLYLPAYAVAILKK